MPNIIEGDFAPPQGRFALVAARFNQVIVDNLVSGATDALLRHGVPDQDIDIIRVPGSFELPLAAHKLAETKKYCSIICLGAIIRGETCHYDHVASGAVSGIAQTALATGIPIVFGVLTCETLEQAVNRSGAKSGNKGFEAALVAIEMVNLLKRIDSE